jgi:hypothetical protein
VKRILKQGLKNYYKDSQVQCKGPVYYEKEKLSAFRLRTIFLFGGWGGVKKTGTQAVRASHDNMAQYY